MIDIMIYLYSTDYE